MPVTTFEMMLQNCSSRITMYGLATGGHYNSRAPTTMPNESFFSDLVRYEKDGSQYPKACNIPRTFGRVVTLNTAKHRPDKCYQLCTSVRNKYPIALAEEDKERLTNESATSFEGEYRDNLFDFPNTHSGHHTRRSDITTGIQPQRTVQGVRQYYRVDESKLLQTDRYLVTSSDSETTETNSGLSLL